MRKLVLGIVILFALTVISCGDNNEDSTPASDNTELYDVTVTQSPSEGGTVTLSDTTIEEGNQLTLEAESAEEFNFTHWNGDIDSTSDNPLSITIDNDYSITANFKIKNYTLDVYTEGEGSVKEKIVQQKSTDYESGTVVELTAEPANTHTFVEWQDDVTGNDNPVQVTIDSPKEITAAFEWGSPFEEGEEDCRPLDPDNIEIEESGDQWRLVDGDNWLLLFDELENAKKARDIIQFYGFTQWCFVGRPDPPFDYWLVNQAPPEKTDDVPFTEDCTGLDPDNIEIEESGDQWQLVDGDNWLLLFDEFENAKKARDTIQFYGFTQRCYVGRPDPPFGYWLR